MFAVYKVTNNVNGHFYIGITTQLPPKRRWTAHKYDAVHKHIPSALHHAIRKYGAKQFSFELLEVGENHTYGFGVAEPLYIKWMKPEYNLTSGGEGSRGGSFHQRQTRSKRMQGKTLPDSWRKNISLGQTGTKRGPHSPEHTLSQSLGQLGRKDTLKTKLNKRIAALRVWEKRKGNL